jgi:hypothetical protein
MGSVFNVLDEIRARPNMYLGWDELHRVQQLQNLETLLRGYSIALEQHGIREAVTEFTRDFGAYLLETKGWSASCGPTAAVRDAARSDAETWELFWQLVDEFRNKVEPDRRTS